MLLIITRSCNLPILPISLQAKVLMKGVDDITLGMGGAADTLILAAQSGDAGLLQDQATSIKTLANSLQVMAKDAMEG